MVEDLSNTQTASTDNSANEPSLSEQVSAALEEPEKQTETDTTKTEETAQNEPANGSEEHQDNIVECPDKFKNKDGSINVDKLAKSYKELEPLLNEKAAWEKEKAELLEAKQQLDARKQEEERLQEQQARTEGYDSVADMQIANYLAGYEANEYAQYLSLLDDDDRSYVQGLINDYVQNPSPDIMKDIELEFAPEINKRIAVQRDRLEQQIRNEMKQEDETRAMTSVEDVIKNSIQSNPDVFQYQPFGDLFLSAIRKYGANFTQEDSDALVDMMKSMKEVYRKEFEKEYGVAKENKEITDKLASISGTNSATTADVQDFDKMTPKQKAALIQKLV